MFTSPGSPVLSMRLATFTVSPQMSYWNLRRPTIPATTGPVWMPTRISKVGLPRALRSACRSRRMCCISRPASTTATGMPPLGSGTPPAAMYASPMVLIFSTPYFSMMRSKALKQTLSSSTSSAAVSCSVMRVKSRKSLKSTVTWSKLRASAVPRTFSSLATFSGRMFFRSSSLRSFSCLSSRVRSATVRSSTTCCTRKLRMYSKVPPMITIPQSV